MENSEKVSLALGKIQQQADELHKYLDTWFANLPLEGMQDVIEDYNSPDREDYTATQEGADNYLYDLMEYQDSLYGDYSEVSLDVKINDFRIYASKYADNMYADWDFIEYADFAK